MPNDFLRDDYVPAFRSTSIADIGKRPEPPKPAPEASHLEEQSDLSQLLEQMRK